MISVNLWTGPSPLILASQSASRRMLLANAGLAFETRPADLDERALQEKSGLREPGAIAALLACAKAAQVAALNPGCYVIGADQTLALGDKLFSKPAGRKQAAEQIRLLAGGTHQLHSAIAVACDGRTVFEAVTVAHMTMRPLGDIAIERYLDDAGDAVTRSVGAYQLEGLGVHLFERIDGDHFTILGLPLVPLLDFFRRTGLLAI
jgi:septum formation protein